MTEPTEAWNITLSPVLVWLQEVFSYRFLAHESIRSWSFKILVSSLQFRVLWFDALRPNRGLKEPPWGIPGWSVLSSALPWGLLWRDCCAEILPRALWALCLSSLCSVDRSSAGHTGYPRALQLHLNYSALPLQGAVRAWVCCCTWLHFKQLPELCQDAKLFMALMHQAVPSCPWNIQQSNIHPCRKDHSNLFHRIIYLQVRSKPGCQKLKARIKSRDTLFYYIIKKKKNLDSPLAGTGGWRLTDRNKIAKNKFYVAIFFLPQMWMLMQNTLL